MNERFKRLEGETDNQYQVRLTVLKLIEKEDIDWGEIQELLNNGQHKDTIRKSGQGIAIAYEVYEELIENMQSEYKAKLKLLQSKVNDEIEDKRVNEIKNKVLQLEKEKIKLKDQRNELNATKRSMARIEHLIEETREEILRLNQDKPLITPYVAPIESEVDGVVLLSDLHIGAYCDNILDKYNPEICKDKLNYYIDVVCKEIIKRDINKVHFLVAGDVMSGIIHNTTRYSNRLNACQQVTFASELLAQSINKISQYARVEVGIVAGNHDRIIIDKSEHVEDENFVEFIREMVRLRLIDNPNVTIIQPEDPTLLTTVIREQNVAVVHGNLDRTRTIDRLVEMRGMVFDYVLMGHYHKFEVKPHNNTTIIVNGAFGGEDYAKNSRLYNKPCQLFMTFNNYGLDEIKPINLNLYNK